VTSAPQAIDVASLLAEPSRAQSLRREQVPALLCQLAALQAVLASRLGSGETIAAVAEDSLLTVAEAAERLGLSRDWLYRHSRQLSFTVRVGRHLRFSSHGIDRYIRQRQGR
jgi:excisionase family DNA binding protein